MLKSEHFGYAFTLIICVSARFGTFPPLSSSEISRLIWISSQAAGGVVRRGGGWRRVGGRLARVWKRMVEYLVTQCPLHTLHNRDDEWHSCSVAKVNYLLLSFSSETNFTVVRGFQMRTKNVKSQTEFTVQFSGFFWVKSFQTCTAEKFVSA